MFAEELYQNAIKDKSIYIIVADISPAGNMQNFQKKYYKIADFLQRKSQ